MPRNGTGTYTPPPNINPVIEGTTIEASWANTTVNDLSAGITGSLPRNGEAPMTGTLKITEGTVAAPGLAFNAEASTGFFRPATGVIALTANGVEQIRWTSGNLLLGSTTNTGEKLQVTGTSKFVGNVTITGATNITGATSHVGVANFTTTTAADGAARLTGGVLYLEKDTIPQVVLRDTNAAADQQRWSLWLADGADSVAIGHQTDAGSGTPVFVARRSSGGTATLYGSNLTIQNGVGSAVLGLTGTAGTQRNIVVTTAGAARWGFGADLNAESGSNAGSNFFINRHNDAGTYIDTPLLINRSTGVTTITNLAATVVNSVGTIAASNGDIKNPVLTMTGDRLENWLEAKNDAVTGINYRGYNGGTTYFRNFMVFDGKQGGILTLTGATKTAAFAGAVGAPNFVSTSMNGVRLKTAVDASSYGVILRNDTQNFHILFTNNNDADGTFNTLRPLYFNLSTGDAFMNHALTVQGAVTTSAVTTSAATVNGTVTAATVAADRMLAKVFLEEADERASVTGTVELNLANFSIFDYTLTGATTLTYGAFPNRAAGEVFSWVVRITQGATAQTLTWPTGIIWLTPGGTQPPTPGANKIAEYIFTRKSDGTTHGRRGSFT